MSNTFQWDDSSVKEFVTKLLQEGFYDIPKHLNDFKNQQSKPDYEIILYRFESLGICIDKTSDKWEEAKSNTDYKIWSVKRLHDGIIFEVGDMIEFGDFGPKGSTAIEKFLVSSFDNNYIAAYHGAHGLGLEKWEKTKPILFYTEDSKPVYEGDEIWQVSLLRDSNKCCSTNARPEITPVPSYFKYFSTKELGIEWIALNKSILNLNEVKEIGKINDDNLYFKRLIETAKNKLNS